MRQQLLIGFMSVALGLGFAIPASAQSAEQIVEKMLSKDAFGWDQAESRVRMVLTDKKGKRKERVMETLRRKKNGNLQSVVRFRSPAEVAGSGEAGGGISPRWLHCQAFHPISGR